MILIQNDCCQKEKKMFVDASQIFRNFLWKKLPVYSRIITVPTILDIPYQERYNKYRQHFFNTNLREKKPLNYPLPIVTALEFAWS